MKLGYTVIALAFVGAVSANTNPQNCFTIKNNIDRKYCIDKYLESVKNNFASEKKSWGTAVPANVKTSRSEALTYDIQAKKDQKALLDTEIALTEKHLADLNSMQVAAANKKKDKKKDKKKLPFGIKL